ncbi:formimidoylglutamase [Salmonella enterica subsp. enterica serovar Heidelberg]|nr:formimidoylglutamase [Salmonella enterica subsp. enterica serovar Heidelberg]
MTQWYPASPALWQGRDDSIEAPDARRLFQTVTRSETFSPENWQQKIALMGFACDEGVKRNAGRPGAAGAPDALRKALANMASHQGHERLVDLGNWVAPTPDLEGAQQALRDAVSRCLRAGMRTLVLGGGHETAFGHGAGVLDAFAQESVGIINLDAHLDLRQTDRATSGTPFRQLAQLCDAQSRAFHYACFGVSRAANTQALWREAQWRNVTVVEDLDCHDALAQMAQFIDDNKIALGLVVGLDYSNPWLSPFQEMQRLKTHPSIRKYIDRGKRIGYGARAINNGGIASMPDPCLPGGLLIGCNAGTLNASRIKGIHTAIKSGMIAADAIFNALLDNRKNDILTEYQTLLRQSWLWQELENGSNFKPWFKKGRVIGFIMTGIEHWLLPRMGIKKIPWRVKNNRPDNITLQPANKSQKKLYDKPDGKLTFDILSSVYLSNTWHDDDQPVHLKISDQNIPISINLDIYGGPEERYCPAGVYEFLQDSETQNMRLQINSQNCIHCKVCDIKDPKQNITWTTPEGGNGPNYTGM